MKKIALILLLCLFFSPNDKVMGNSTEFSYADMAGNSADYAAVKLVELGVIKGERVGEEYYFHPDKTVTRSEAISYLNAALGIAKTTVDTKDINIFADCKELTERVKKNAYIAYKAGIIKGKRENDGLYLVPNEEITRAEFFSMIDRAAGGKTAGETELLHPDSSQIPDYAKISVKNLCAYKIIENSNTLLRPKEALKRDEMAEILYNLIKFKEESTTKVLSQRIKEELYQKQLS